MFPAGQQQWVSKQISAKKWSLSTRWSPIIGCGGARAALVLRWWDIWCLWGSDRGDIDTRQLWEVSSVHSGYYKELERPCQSSGSLSNRADPALTILSADEMISTDYRSEGGSCSASSGTLGSSSTRSLVERHGWRKERSSSWPLWLDGCRHGFHQHDNDSLLHDSSAVQVDIFLIHWQTDFCCLLGWAGLGRAQHTESLAVQLRLAEMMCLCSNTDGGSPRSADDGTRVMMMMMMLQPQQHNNKSRGLKASQSRVVSSLSLHFVCYKLLVEELSGEQLVGITNGGVMQKKESDSQKEREEERRSARETTVEVKQLCDDGVGTK